MIVKFGREAGQVVGGGPAEEVAGEDAGPGGLGVDAQRAAVRRDAAPMKQSWAKSRLSATYVDEAGAEPVVVLLADRAG